MLGSVVSGTYCTTELKTVTACDNTGTLVSLKLRH